MCRSAGSSAQIVARDGRYVTLKLPSGQIRKVLSQCMATSGLVSNEEHFNTMMGKAGRNRWKGFRPSTRGVAMNPVTIQWVVVKEKHREGILVHPGEDMPKEKNKKFKKKSKRLIL